MTVGFQVFAWTDVGELSQYIIRKWGGELIAGRVLLRLASVATIAATKK